MPCDCTTYPKSGNPVSGIPVKVGEPLSSACERVIRVGAVPNIFKYPGFTLVNGAPVTGIPSNGGIQNMISFFNYDDGCYSHYRARIATTCE